MNEDRRRARTVLAVACLGVLLAQIDTSVVNLALAPIRASTGASSVTLRWIIDAYNIAYGGAIVVTGTIADVCGRRRIFVAGVAAFALGSFACAAAPDPALLVGARAVAGIGAALMVPASLALLSSAFSGAERAHALGIWAAMNGAAFVIGPTAGGILADAFGWRSLFAVVLPFAAVAAGSALRLPADRGMRTLPEAVALARRGTRLFADVRFSGSLVTIATMTFGMYGVLFLTPLTLQALAHWSATAAGFALLPMSVVFAAVSSVSGAIVGVLGNRVAIALGMGVMAGGCGLLAVPGVPFLLVGIGLTGLGMGLATGPLLGFPVARAPADVAGTGSGIANAARMAGASLGVALLGGAFHAGDPRTSWPYIVAACVQAFGALVAVCAVPARSHDRPSA